HSAPRHSRIRDTLAYAHGTLPLHDALPISRRARTAPACTPRAGSPPSTKWWVGWTNPRRWRRRAAACPAATASSATTAMRCAPRSEEHTSELQSREKLVCRLLLEKKKDTTF